MKDYFQFIGRNPLMLSFGFALTFLSGTGQTFLLSLYVPELAETLQVSMGKMGSYYAVATLSSAALLSYLGSLIDRVSLDRYTLSVLVGSVMALAFLSISHHWWMVVIGLLGLRLTGQGLMSHVSITSMARYFDKDRGKAISLATLGFPASEAVLPLIVALIIAAVGWRWSLRLSALFVLVVALPLLYLMLKRLARFYDLSLRTEKGRAEELKKVPFRLVLSRANFWLIAPNVFLLGFINTAIFFYQVELGNVRDWSRTEVAASLGAFAMASAVGMFLSGPLVDRFSAKRIFPWYLFPYLISLLGLAYIQPAWAYPLVLVGLGLSNGLGNTVKNALMAELFGLRLLGSVRSIFTVLMVISTALGPLSFGLLLDAGYSFKKVFLLVALAIALAILQSFRASRHQPQRL